MGKYEVYILDKINSGKKLSEDELQELVFDYEFDSIEGDDSRWSRSMSSIIELGERFFRINWEKGLTEMQENEFYDQPYEVEKQSCEKTITIVSWAKKR